METRTVGQVWRTGANEATTFVPSSDVVVGGKDVPAGSYTIFTVPPGQVDAHHQQEDREWGIPYTYESDELARVDMKVSKLPAPVENFTVAYDKSRQRLHFADRLGEHSRNPVDISAKMTVGNKLLLADFDG